MKEHGVDGTRGNVCDILEKILKESLCLNTDGRKILNSPRGWNYLTQNRTQREAFVNTIITLRVP